MRGIKQIFAILLSFLLVMPPAFAADYCASIFGGRAEELKVAALRQEAAQDNYWENYKKSLLDPFFTIRKDQKKNTGMYLNGNEETSLLLSTFATMQEQFLTKRHVRLDELPSQMLRLVNYESYKQFKKDHPKQSTMEIYGVDTMKSWKEADDYLASIPVGKFEITEELIQKVASYSSRELKPLPFSIPGITPEAGRFKLLPNSGRSPLREPLTEDQYQNLKQNKWISGFIEMPRPWSKPGKRRGIILYALPHTVNGKLKKLVEWYNENKNTMDPIRLAAEFQRNFVSIHPLVDGNGRASRLLMDRILLEHGLPPVVLLNHNMDLYLSIEDYTQAIRIGVADSINLLKTDVQRMGRVGSGKSGPEISDIDDYSMPKHWVDRAAVAKFNELQKYRFQVGDRKFSMDNDGFIYDQFGVPHEYNDGRFYPIADRMTELYDFGGEVKKYKARHERWGYTERGGYEQIGEYFTTESHRQFSPLKKSIFEKHLRIIDKIKSGQISVEGLKAEPLSLVKKANEHGEIHIYPWQAKQFADALAMRNESAPDLLTPFYRNRTNYAQHKRGGKIPPATLTLAQYEHLDMALYDYQKASGRYPQLRKAIESQRAAIHKAARDEVMKSMAEFEKLSSADKKLAESDFRFQLFKEYLGISKLRYSTFAEAQKAGADNYVPLLRVSNRMSTTLGFVPVMTYKKVLSKVPFFGRFLNWAEALNKEVQEKGTDVLVKKIEAIKFLPKKTKDSLIAKIKGSEDAFQSALDTFVSDMLMVPGTQTPYSLAGDRKSYILLNRAGGGDHDEGGLSFSTNPELYFHGNMFANGEGDQVAVHVTKAPRNAIIQNYMSGFASEYEVIGFKPFGPKNIVKRFSGTEMQKKVDFPNGELGRVMRKLLGISHVNEHGEIELGNRNDKGDSTDAGMEEAG